MPFESLVVRAAGDLWVGPRTTRVTLYSKRLPGGEDGPREQARAGEQQERPTSGQSADAPLAHG
eukprot:7265943-Alexandrium_andersonii.AAC.1